MDTRPARLANTRSLWGSAWSSIPSVTTAASNPPGIRLVHRPSQLDSIGTKPLASFLQPQNSRTPQFCQETKQYVIPFSGHHVSSNIYSAVPFHNCQALLTSSSDNTHKMWDIFTQTGISSFAGFQLDIQPRPVIASDDQFIACGSLAGNLLLWNPLDLSSAMTCIESLHRFPISCTAFDSLASFICSADTTGELSILSL